MDLDLTVKRFAIDYANTALIVEYKTGAGKRFMRKIRFKRYKAGVDPSRVAAKLMSQFDDVLGRDKVSEEQVLELVSLLLSKEPPSKKTIEAKAPADKENTAKKKENVEDAQFGDLNKVSEEENIKAKEVMNKGFEENVLRPGDEGYVYDKQVSFGEASEENDWDMESVEDDF